MASPYSDDDPKVIKAVHDVAAILYTDLSVSMKASSIDAIMKALRAVSASAPSASAATGGGGSIPSGARLTTTQAPPKPMSYSDLASRVSDTPKATPARRPDQPPALAPPNMEDDTPSFWDEEVKDILSKTLKGTPPSEEDVKTIWDFLWNKFPHKTFPSTESIYDTLKYGVKCDYYYEETYMPLHVFFQQHHRNRSVRHFFKVVYDKDGNYKLD